MTTESATTHRGVAVLRDNTTLVVLSVFWLSCAIYLLTRSTTLFFSSLSLVASLVLVALGLTIIFGIMQIANFAHGEFVMIGAFVAWGVTDAFDSSQALYLALPAAFAVAALVGLLMETTVLRWVYDKGLIAPMLATWAVGIVIREYTRLEFGAGFKRVPAPLVEPWHVAGITIPSYNLFMVGVCVVVVTLLWLLYAKTSFGQKSRATAEDGEMAAAVGINVRAIYRSSIALGSGLAGLSGALIAPLVAINPFMGVTWLVKGFFVVIVGGPGSILGAVSGGNAMGWPDQFMATVFEANGALYGQLTVIVVAAAIILLKPEGLVVRMRGGRSD
jgi:branched-subunit amino acid ABC-type transport system permease component